MNEDTVKSAVELFSGYKIHKRKGPTSERSDLLQQICDATGIPFKLLLRETFHLKDDWGNEILRLVLEDSLAYSSEREWRRVKAAELIRKSK